MSGIRADHVEAVAAAVEREDAADAAAVLAKGRAAAEAMGKGADASRRYDEAAVLDLVARVLPDSRSDPTSPASTYGPSWPG